MLLRCPIWNVWRVSLDGACILFHRGVVKIKMPRFIFFTVARGVFLVATDCEVVTRESLNWNGFGTDALPLPQAFRVNQVVHA